jgi:GNAT superfamily N-acetyltransferase
MIPLGQHPAEVDDLRLRPVDRVRLINRSRRRHRSVTIGAMDIAVVPLDVTDDDATDRAYEIVAASHAADVPDLPLCRQRFVGGLRHPMPGNRPQHALAYLDGEPVGYLGIDLPQLDNIDNAEVDIQVHPRRRRRGVGRALHERAVRLFHEQGRRRVMGESPAALSGGPPGTDAGSAFAIAMGARAALTDVRRRLDVTRLDHVGLARLLDAARSRAEGYSLVRWQGSAPQEYVDDVAYLDSRLLQDAPLGDLEWEPQKVDAARVRAAEEALRARGRRCYHSGMRHDATGQIVAWTMLDFGATNRWHAFQQITIVEPRHRGHRLGVIVKIGNLRYAMAYEPELRAVDTWNAAANEHMISINEAIGFRPADRWYNWQLVL